jgi:tetratricopeptide (TPR) repeat protein
MMHWHYLRHGLPIALLSLFIFQNAQAYEVDPATFLALPRHCQAQFAMRADRVEGIQLDRARYEKDIEHYKRQFSGARGLGLNHYCPGLVALIRAERLPQGANDEIRNRLIATAFTQVSILFAGAVWTENTLWLKAEGNRNLGRIYLLKKQPGEAIRHFQQAIDAYPAYIPAYWDLAELKRRQQHFDEAISHLEKALLQDPSAKQAKLIEARIREIETEKTSSASPMLKGGVNAASE